MPWGVILVLTTGLEYLNPCVLSRGQEGIYILADAIKLVNTVAFYEFTIQRLTYTGAHTQQKKVFSLHVK